MQDPQNKLPLPESAFDTPNAQDPQNELTMSEQAPHTSAKRHCVSRGAPLEGSKGMLNADWGFRVGAGEKRAHAHRRYVQFCLQHIELESKQSPCSNKELAAAYTGPTEQPMGTNRHIFPFCSKDVLTGSSQCGRLPIRSTFTNPVLVAQIWPTGPITDQIWTVSVWPMRFQGAHC